MIKQVIVIRKDLNMRKGKIASQVAHASMKVVLDTLKEIDSTPKLYSILGYKDFEEFTKFLDNKERSLKEWVTGIFTKIVVYVNSEEELKRIYYEAKDENIICSIIEDIGKTEFHNQPTVTCCAIGPDEEEIIDKITKHLPLL